MNPHPEWSDRYWNSVEGLKLHYRDYAGPHERPPILCLPGLTRNAADFEPVAQRFAGEWRVLSVDFRGRGLSQRDPDPDNYRPATYVGDVLKLLDQLGIADAVFVGTSLGGLVTMQLADTDSERIAGALLNDIGPDIEAAGLERIAQYVGKPARFASLAEAAGRVAAANASVYPDFTDEDWQRFVARLLTGSDAGGWSFAYDPAIAGNFTLPADPEQFAGWRYIEGLSGRPVTLLRGALSDLLSDGAAQRLCAVLDDCELGTVPRVGPAPTFEEPDSIAALERLLERVLAA